MGGDAQVERNASHGTQKHFKTTKLLSWSWAQTELSHRWHAGCPALFEMLFDVASTMRGSKMAVCFENFRFGVPRSIAMG